MSPLSNTRAKDKSMTNRHFLVIAVAVAILSGCVSVKDQLTQQHFKREDQKIWFTGDETQKTIDIVASCISAAEMITDYERAKVTYAQYLRLCYFNISQNGIDVDGGVRGLNFIKKLHQDADGSKKLWKETIELAKQNDSNLPGIPIPAQFK